MILQWFTPIACDLENYADNAKFKHTFADVKYDFVDDKTLEFVENNPSQHVFGPEYKHYLVSPDSIRI